VLGIGLRGVVGGCEVLAREAREGEGVAIFNAAKP
jgi:hypothetical protein